MNKLWKENTAKWQLRWQHASTEEKIISSLSFSFICLLIIYFLILSPYFDHIDQLRSQLASTQKNLAWMKQADLRLKSSNNLAPRKQLSPIALMSNLHTQINAAGLTPALHEMKQLNDNSINIQFQHVNFDSLMRWLISNVKNLNINITHFIATQSIETGETNVAITIST